MLPNPHESPFFRDGEHRVEINAIANWYRIAGTEHTTTPLLILHGGPGGQVYNFERTIGRRLETFATVIYHEQRGCGRSDKPQGRSDYSIDILVSDIDILRQKLGLEKIIPLGFSFGGELALEYTLAHPEHVEKVIVQSPSQGMDERYACTQLYGFKAVAQGAMAETIDAIIKGPGTLKQRLDQVWETVDTETVDRFLFHNAEAAKKNRILWWESGLGNTGDMHRALAAHPPAVPLMDRLQQIQAPTLVMVGLHDRNIGVDACRDLTTRIPQACLELFQHSAHFPDMEEEERYAQNIHDFLRV